MTEQSASAQPAKPKSFWSLFGLMALVALGCLIAGLPTCGFSLYLCGSIGAFFWLNLEKPPRESVKSRSALAGSVTGATVAVLAGVAAMFSPGAKDHITQWAVMITIGIMALALISSLTGLLGGTLYTSRTWPKPALAAPTPGTTIPATRPAALEGLVDLTGASEGDLLPVADASDWADQIRGLVSSEHRNFQVILLRSELDVMLLKLKLQLDSRLERAGVTAIGYGTGDAENEALMEQGHAVVLVPKDVVRYRPLCFHPPTNAPAVDFIILRESKDAVRVVHRPNASLRFRLKLGKE